MGVIIVKPLTARPLPFLASLLVSAYLLTSSTATWAMPIQGYMKDLGQLPDDLLLELPEEAPIPLQDIPRYTWTAGQLLKQGRFAETVSLCQRLLTMQRNNTEARAHLAAAYKGLNDEQQFKREQEIFLKQAPESSAIHHSLAITYTSLKDFAAAEAAYKKGLETASMQTELLMGLGALYMQQQRLQESSEQYLKALKQKGLEDKNFLNASFALCRIDLQEKHYDNVISRAQELTELYPPVPQGHLLLGAAYREKGATEQAIKTYQRLMEINPQVPDAYYELALIYLKKPADAKRALKVAKQAAGKFPEDARTQDVLGWVYYEQQRYPEAVEQFRKAVRLSENNPDLLYHLGLGYQKTAENSQATAAFKRALKLTDTQKAGAFSEELQRRIDQSQ